MTRGRCTAHQDVIDAPAHKVAEIVNDRLYVTPRPLPLVALAKVRLNLVLGTPFGRGRNGPGGWWIFHEPEFHLGDDVLVPDVTGWRRERMPTLRTVEHERLTRRARIHLERLTGDGGPLFECAQGEVRLCRDDHSEGPQFAADWSESALARVAPRADNTRLTSFMEFMRGVIVCGIDPPGFRTESRGESRIPRRDTHNFADCYRHVVQERPDLIPSFTNTLRAVIGGLNAVRLEKVGQDTRALVVVFDEGGKRYELRLDEISDGQRALIASAADNARSSFNTMTNRESVSRSIASAWRPTVPAASRMALASSVGAAMRASILSRNRTHSSAATADPDSASATPPYPYRAHRVNIPDLCGHSTAPHGMRSKPRSSESVRSRAALGAMQPRVRHSSPRR